jgi:hypothetical protein
LRAYSSGAAVFASNGDLQPGRQPVEGRLLLSRGVRVVATQLLDEGSGVDDDPLSCASSSVRVRQRNLGPHRRVELFL